jgi:hypothetical protein
MTKKKWVSKTDVNQRTKKKDFQNCSKLEFFSVFQVLKSFFLNSKFAFVISKKKSTTMVQNTVEMLDIFWGGRGVKSLFFAPPSQQIK